MTVLNLKSLGMPSTAGLIGTARMFWDKWHPEPEAQLPEIAPAAPQPVREAASPDQERYARILEHELDRELLSEVEREDSEMLACVRDALYADD